MSVVEAVKRDLVVLGERSAGFAESTLAATALALAAELDDPGVVASAKAACARSLREAMDRLLELAPTDTEADSLDELGVARAKRRSAAS